MDNYWEKIYDNASDVAKHCYIKCDVAKTIVKEFAEKLKESAQTNLDHFTGFQKVVLVEQIDELLKEYEK